MCSIGGPDCGEQDRVRTRNRCLFLYAVAVQNKLRPRPIKWSQTTLHTLRPAEPESTLEAEESEVESISQLYRELPRIIVVRSREGTITAKEKTVVCDVQSGNRGRQILAQRFSKRDVKRCVRRKMLRAVAIKKARTRNDVCIDICVSPERKLPARSQCLALIVIDVEPRIGRRRKVRHACRNSSGSLYDHV
jgi:hypothetical protein